MARALQLQPPATPSVRSRVAPVATPQAVEIDPKILELANTYWKQNSVMNAAKAAAEKAKKALDIAMSDAGLKTIPDFSVDGVPVEVLYLAETANVVDNAKLISLIGQEKFNEIASVTQDAVKKEVGENLLAKALVEVKKPEALKIRKKKS